MSDRNEEVAPTTPVSINMFSVGASSACEKGHSQNVSSQPKVAPTAIFDNIATCHLKILPTKVIFAKDAFRNRAEPMP
jgi:hypothetical protein